MPSAVHAPSLGWPRSPPACHIPENSTTLRRDRPPRARIASPRCLRASPDSTALRALAVTVVIVFHLSPGDRSSAGTSASTSSSWSAASSSRPCCCANAARPAASRSAASGGAAPAGCCPRSACFVLVCCAAALRRRRRRAASGSARRCSAPSTFSSNWLFIADGVGVLRRDGARAVPQPVVARRRGAVLPACGPLLLVVVLLRVARSRARCSRSSRARRSPRRSRWRCCAGPGRRRPRVYYGTDTHAFGLADRRGRSPSSGAAVAGGGLEWSRAARDRRSASPARSRSPGSSPSRVLHARRRDRSPTAAGSLVVAVLSAVAIAGAARARVAARARARPRAAALDRANAATASTCGTGRCSCSLVRRTADRGRAPDRGWLGARRHRVSPITVAARGPLLPIRGGSRSGGDGFRATRAARSVAGWRRSSGVRLAGRADGDRGRARGRHGDSGRDRRSTPGTSESEASDRGRASARSRKDRATSRATPLPATTARPSDFGSPTAPTPPLTSRPTAG